MICADVFAVLRETQNGPFPVSDETVSSNPLALRVPQVNQSEDWLQLSHCVEVFSGHLSGDSLTGVFKSLAG